MLTNCNNLFNFNGNTRTSIVDCDREEIDDLLDTIDDMSEVVPYTIKKNILDEDVYTWNEKFIKKVLLSFSSTIVQNFSEAEKDLFDRYRSFLIYGIDTVIDEDVQKLDEYIGTLGIIGVNI